MPKNSSNSRSKEVVLDENVRHSPIGAETSDEELQHANLDEADDWEPWEDEELCASPNSNQFDEIFPSFFNLFLVIVLVWAMMTHLSSGSQYTKTL